jgi:hypothetical protein
MPMVNGRWISDVDYLASGAGFHAEQARKYGQGYMASTVADVIHSNWARQQELLRNRPYPSRSNGVVDHHHYLCPPRKASLDSAWNAITRMGWKSIKFGGNLTWRLLRAVASGLYVILSKLLSGIRRRLEARYGVGQK